MKRTFFIILLITNYSLLINKSFGQSITWQRTYDGPFNFRDYGNDVCLSENVNFFIVGETQNPNWSYAYVLKLNPYGDTIWTRIIDTVARFVSVTSSGDGGCVATAGSSTTKIDINGNIVWHKRYLSGGINTYRIIKTIDGGYIACGRSTLTGISGYVFKTDSIGNLQWQRTYPAGEAKFLNDVVQANDGNYVLSGNVSESLTDTTRVLIMKINNVGDVIWEKRYMINNRAAAGFSINKLNNGYIVGGIGGSAITSQMFIMRVNEIGDSLFTKSYLTTKDEVFGDMKVINENRYVIASFKDSIGQIFNGHARITDSSGNILTEKVFPSVNNIEIFSILPMPNRDILFVGTNGNNNTPPYWNVYAMRTDSMLNSPPFGIQQISSELPAEFKLYQNYPNPFNSSTIVKFDLSKENFISIKIYDYLGREVTTLFNGNLRIGAYSISWDATNYSSGIYFCYMVSNKFSLVKKMVLIR